MTRRRAASDDHLQTLSGTIAYLDANPDRASDFLTDPRRTVRDRATHIMETRTQ